LGGRIKGWVWAYFRRYPFWGVLKRNRRIYAKGLANLCFVDAINVALPLFIKAGVDAIAARDIEKCLWAGGLYFALMAVQAVGRYWWRIYLIGVSHQIAADLRQNLYSHLQRLPLRYYQKVRTGDLMSRATNDIESIRMTLGPGILVTADAIVMFFMIVPVMLILSWKLSLLAFAFYPLVPFLTFRLGNKIDNLYETLQERMSQMGAFIQEHFSAVRLLKALVLERRTESRFRELSESYRQVGVEMARFQSVLSPVLGLFTNLGTFLILVWGGWDVLHGAITVGTYIAFQRFVVQLSWPMEAIGWAVTMNREGIAAHRRLETITEQPEVVPAYPAAAGISPSEAWLEIPSLHFHYDKGPSAFSLNLEQLRLEKGKKVGIVGQVGSGKSTFFQLLLRLYEPEPNEIFLAGKDVRAIPLPELRKRVASVEQPIFLFSETIAENLEMGLGKMLSDDVLWKALEVAGIAEEIRGLDKGLRSKLGERGVNFSGGQKQRLALARALVREPELLVLDDSLSAVDVAIESKILKEFFATYPDLSVLFASHRLSVMPRLDEVWLFDGGKLVGKGPHSELMKRQPLYARLWEKSQRDTEREYFEKEVEASV